MAISVGIIAVPLPGVGEAIDAGVMAHLALLAADFQRLQKEKDAAAAFVAHAPYTLDELRVSPVDASFSSYGAFYKLLLEKYFGPASQGYQYHHIVEGGGENEINIPQQELQNTSNIIRLPTLIHEVVSAEYSRSIGENGPTFREWLQTQPLDVQYREGLKVLRNLGILKEE